jgi:hypothetical protein
MQRFFASIGENDFGPTTVGDFQADDSFHFSFFKKCLRVNPAPRKLLVRDRYKLPPGPSSVVFQANSNNANPRRQIINQRHISIGASWQRKNPRKSPRPKTNPSR